MWVLIMPSESGRKGSGPMGVLLDISWRGLQGYIMEGVTWRRSDLVPTW